MAQVCAFCSPNLPDTGDLIRQRRGVQDHALAIKNESRFYRDKQGIKGLAVPFPCTPNPRRSSFASLRRLFAFSGTRFGFPLESAFTFTGIPNIASCWNSAVLCEISVLFFHS